MSNGPRRSVLVVDDDEAMCTVVADWLGRRGFTVEWRTSALAALERLREREPDALISDLSMPGMDGLTLCREVAAAWPSLPVLVLTAHGTYDAAIEAIRAGAYDFLAKPVELDVLVLAIERALSHAALRREVTRLRSATSPARSFGLLWGDSPAMRTLYEQIDRCADSTATVLVTGESGTGKELVARALHEHSGRASFVALNCAAMPEALIESELFGHVRGSFTGAHRDHPGLFERGHGGTVFLDEIGELPQPAQAKLLRVLEERVVRPVGGEHERPVDVRVIAATHCDLEALVIERRFREDLFYRLDVLSIHLPPLRARGNDVLVLAEHFLRQAAAEANKALVGMSLPVSEALLRYRWPGNVRELRNCIERAVIFAAHDRLVVDDLPHKILDGAGPGAVVAVPDETEGFLPLDEVERRYVLAVLDALGGNKSEAGRVLGLDRRTIARKLRAWGLD